MAADSTNKPLGTWNTCRHLTTGVDAEQEGRFYPRCALGSREQRLRWLAEVSPSRLEVVRALQDEFDQLSLGQRERLDAARTRLQGESFMPSASPEVQQVVNDFLERIDEFLWANSERLQDVGLPVDGLRGLISEWIWAWLRTPLIDAPSVREDLVQGLGNGSRAFLGLPMQIRPPATIRLLDRPLYRDAILEIVPTAQPPGIALIGDVDFSNIAAVRSALAGLSESDGDVHLDLSELLFCDLGGLQAIVRAAQALPTGRRMVLHGIPRQIDRALEMFDWAPLPNLVVAEVPSA